MVGDRAAVLHSVLEVGINDRSCQFFVRSGWQAARIGTAGSHALAQRMDPFHSVDYLILLPWSEIFVQIATMLSSAAERQCLETAAVRKRVRLTVADIGTG